jgi:hypothetical protein
MAFFRSHRNVFLIAGKLVTLFKPNRFDQAFDAESRHHWFSPNCGYSGALPGGRVAATRSHSDFTGHASCFFEITFVLVRFDHVARLTPSRLPFTIATNWSASYATFAATNGTLTLPESMASLCSMNTKRKLRKCFPTKNPKINWSEDPSRARVLCA